VRVERSTRIDVGAEVGICADTGAMHVFDRSSGARLPTEVEAEREPLSTSAGIGAVGTEGQS
jgi:hypothetical protein